MDSALIERPATLAARLNVRVASSEADRLRAFRLRYDVYVTEQRKAYADADHKNGLLTDPLDAEAVILMAEEGADACGTVRSNWFDSSATAHTYGSLFQTDRFSRLSPTEMSVCSRLSVAPTSRSTDVARLLLAGIYEYGLRRGTTLCFATCVPPVLRIFRRYGSREYAPPVIDQAAGKLHRTILVLDDIAHFARVGSPLLAIARTHAVVSVHRPWLNHLLDTYEALGTDA
jgi:hypothetical protein